ncbi:MAG: ferrous iron transport protein A [Lachnospiraceae bacterium]|nr:ferrous iron transport protein A [Lachnospiraceae bacterium]MBQ8412624.1 ferrous iron transport protein A [Lachnospiraceae bacterium]
MTLRDLKPGQSGVVASIGGAGNIRRRVLEMGVTPGTKIDVIKVAPLGDPVEVVLRGYNLSLRKEEAEAITMQ